MHRNTTYFYNILKARRRHAKIVSLKNMHGERIQNEEWIKKELVGYFKSIMGSESVCNKRLNKEILNEGKALTEEQKGMLIEYFDDEQIKNAVYNMDGNRAPGPDGYTVDFFKKIRA